MSRKVSQFAGKRAPHAMLVDVPKLIRAYYEKIPDPAMTSQRVLFGTSGHRGSAFEYTFNEWHILAITQAICLYRQLQKIDGPLFIGFDTHALSKPAFASALEVLSENNVAIMIAENDEYTPTPVISHAIINYNQGRTEGLADGIVITPSHNPPKYGGFKYNPPSGGPADIDVTSWIEKTANALLGNKLRGVKRSAFEKALKASTTHRYDYLNRYVNDLKNVIDMDLIRSADMHLGVDPLGGAGVHYWKPIAQRYQLNLSVVNDVVDPTFRFMTVDWDGQIRMDPSSPYAMVKLVEMKDCFDIAFACDTDHDRHGIVTKKAGLLPTNHYLCAALSYLFQHRPCWPRSKSVGKTLVSSQMINWVSEKWGRAVYEVPVGFKWFVNGLLDGSLGFCGEESAGATLSRINGNVWTTDKDGIALALLSAEITAKLGRDLSDVYSDFENEFGKTFYELDEAAASLEQKIILKKLSAAQVKTTQLAGEKIESILTNAPGNDAAIGGIKVISKKGWFAARPSGTEEIYKIYAESYQDDNHLKQILIDAQTMINTALYGEQDDK
ncbi:MAG: alpha-D-glucose phosphate-specific phosphoglucomutase [Gammaproteobacteria bacterium CG_4_10_14_0_8_um_filter_38_16]|nr:MAG: alpha-D-glucose phosphate-specific phosphoglucomutase [Gammaproteobacteria bacterium CG_4_10_14_0_8_um_filter_38_16]PJA02820.1 MAG: alpha-D-glucose phosphate-specific phosphoglucomutase [Gammaproteobacteria bacterium CG_4_10_14_0_2_um_filter_38_22]PJB09656.1 MAG: alpha-D-glucose phosphate-specific phosphoglucomutase [Gammaproteobacteria bacterium CG_4_9_14_3_um_filter_38_9]